VEDEELQKALLLATDFFFSEWEKNFRTPTVHERIRFMSECLAIDLQQEQVIQLADYFGSLIFVIPPQKIGSVKNQIPYLAEKFPLGLISDTGYISGKYIRLFLAQEGLDRYFQSFVFSDEQSNSKPHRSAFEKTASNLKVSLPRLIHIGDMERTDIAGARQAGCFTIKYTGAHRPLEENQTQAHYVINDYQQLMETLDKAVMDIMGAEKI
jgi:putative hydrolase of the HAD superfamily